MAIKHRLRGLLIHVVTEALCLEELRGEYFTAEILISLIFPVNVGDSL